MARTAWQDRVIADPDVHHGTPCIKGTHVPVATIVGSLADGMSEQEVLRAYPQLTDQDIRAALACAINLN